MLTKFDLVYLSQSNLINSCARGKILVFLLLLLPLFLSFPQPSWVLLFCFTLMSVLQRSWKTLKLITLAQMSLVPWFSALIMGFLLLELRIRRTFLSVLQFLFSFWKTEEVSWCCSLDYKIHFSVTSECLSLINFPLNPSPSSISQYPVFKAGIHLQGFCMNLTLSVVSKNSTPRCI